MSFKSLSSNSFERRQKSKDGADSAYKLVMVGDSGVGKSCLLEKLLDSASNNHFISTIGVDIRTHSVTHNGETYKLQVWDTGGQQRYRPVLSTCYRNAHGVLMVFDVTSEKSFGNLPQWIKEVEEFTSSAARPVPRVLVGNKSDLSDRRKVTAQSAGAFAKANGFLTYIETSAIATTNINEAFLELVRSAEIPAAPTAQQQQGDQD